jgi:hypothetical protein
MASWKNVLLRLLPCAVYVATRQIAKRMFRDARAWLACFQLRAAPKCSPILIFLFLNIFLNLNKFKMYNLEFDNLKGTNFEFE